MVDGAVLGYSDDTVHFRAHINVGSVMYACMDVLCWMCSLWDTLYVCVCSGLHFWSVACKCGRRRYEWLRTHLQTRLFCSQLYHHHRHHHHYHHVSTVALNLLDITSDFFYWRKVSHRHHVCNRWLAKNIAHTVCHCVYVLSLYQTSGYSTGWSKSLCAPDDYSTKLMIWRWLSQNTFGMWTVLYWTLFSRTQFGMSINVWRLAGDTLNITCNFLYCNHQVHRDFLITL